MISRFAYPVTLTPDRDDGGYVVTFRDFSEAITQGETVMECLDEALDCLEEAIAGRMDDGEDIPEPSPSEPGEHLVAVPTLLALKAALHMLTREEGVSKVALAQKLKIDEKAVRRMLSPRYQSKLGNLERALALFGRTPVVNLRDTGHRPGESG
jgi:antitoxin HicB